VFQSGVPLTVAGLEVTTMMRLDEERQKRLFGYGTPVTDALAALTNLWGGHIPVLYDPFAVAYAAGYVFCDQEEQRVTVDDGGFTRIESGGVKNLTVLVRPRADEFLSWFVERFEPVRSEK
jgi:inosine-uridine nucleoside N-ribohydrolase